MSKSSYENSDSPLAASLVRTPFQQSDKKVKKTMRSVPDTLRTAAIQLLERVRTGLDIPSRSEVLDLADRINAIAEKLDSLESKRSADSQLVAELRNAKAKVTNQPLPLIPKAEASNASAKAGSSLAAAAARLQAKPKARAEGPGNSTTASKARASLKPKAKPRAAIKAKAATKAKAKAAASTAKKAAASKKPAKAKTSKRPKSKASKG